MAYNQKSNQKQHSFVPRSSQKPNSSRLLRSQSIQKCVVSLQDNGLISPDANSNDSIKTISPSGGSIKEKSPLSDQPSSSVSNLRRSTSYQSVNILDGSGFEDMTVIQIFKTIRININKITKDSANAISNSSNDFLRTIRHGLHVLEKKYLVDQSTSETKLTVLSGTLENLNSALKDKSNTTVPSSHINLLSSNIDVLNNKIDSIATQLPPTDLAEAMDVQLKCFNDRLSKIEQVTEQIAKKAEECLFPTALVDRPSSPSEPMSAPVNTVHPSTGDDHSTLQPIHRRTLLIKQIATGTRRISGRDLLRNIEMERIAFPTGKIDVQVRRFHIEIVCKSQEDLKILKVELGRNQKLNKYLNFVSKSVPMQKMLLLGVPVKYSKENITSAFTNSSNCTEDDIIIIRSKPSKIIGVVNWILVMPLPLAQLVVAGSGVTIGLTRCRLMPYTTILRCTYCQGFGHATKYCKNRSNCDNCGHHHEGTSSSPCEEPASCINCNISNKNLSTDYLADHPASYYKCSVYSNLYQLEKNRLDALFGIKRQTFQQPIPYPPDFNEPAGASAPQDFASDEYYNNFTDFPTNPAHTYRQSTNHRNEYIDLELDSRPAPPRTFTSFFNSEAPQMRSPSRFFPPRLRSGRP